MAMEVHEISKTNKDVNISEKGFIGKLRQIIATACVGPISLGVAFNWTSPVLPQLIQNNTTNSSQSGLTVSDGSWIGSMLAIGVLLTAIPIGYLIGRFGTKICTLLLLIPMLAFTVMVILFNDVYSLCAARFLLGIAIGGIALTGPMYISEISEVSLRGTLGSLFELLTHLGGLCVAICGTYVNYVTLTSILGIVNLVLGLIFLCLPDSPIYLMKRKKRDQAALALKFYRHNNYNAENDLNELHCRLHNAEQSERNKWEAIKSKRVIRGLIATIGLTIFQQLSGIEAIAFYLVQIFQAADTNIDDYLSAIIVTAAQVVSAIAVLFVIEKAGRKAFLYISAVSMAVCLFAVGLYFHLKKFDVDFPGLKFVPITGLVLHSLAYSIGLGPIPWIINGELFASDIKEVANGLTMTADVLCLFLVTKISPVVMDTYGVEYTFYFFAACMVLCVIFVKFCLIETRGKSLHEIQLDLT